MAATDVLPARMATRQRARRGTRGVDAPLGVARVGEIGESLEQRSGRHGRLHVRKSASYPTRPDQPTSIDESPWAPSLDYVPRSGKGAPHALSTLCVTNRFEPCGGAESWSANAHNPCSFGPSVRHRFT